MDKFVGVNDIPIITANDPINTLEESPFTISKDQLDIQDPDNTIEEITLTILEGENYTSTGLTVTPSLNYYGNLEVLIQASDLTGESDVYNLSLVEVSNVNDKPSFIIEDDLTVAEDSVVSIQVSLFDPDLEDELNAAEISLPDWLSFNSETLVLSGIPLRKDIGNNSVTLQVYDGTVTSDSTFIIEVLTTNDPPSFTSIPDTIGDDNVWYSYSLEADDPDEDELSFELIEKPDFLTLNKQNNRLEGLPEGADTGIHHIEIKVTDGNLVDYQKFDLNILDINSPPEFETTDPETTIDIGGAYSFYFHASDDDIEDVLTYDAIELPDFLRVLTDFSIITGRPTVDDIGPHTIILEVSDGDTIDRLFYTLTVKKANAIELVNFSNLGIKIYPTVVDDILKISLKDNFNKLTINLINLQGQVVMSNQHRSYISNEILNIDVFDIPSGTYIVLVRTDQFTGSQKITVRH